MMRLVFSSLTFLLLFLPVTVGLYFLSSKIRWKNTVLLAASLVFYAWGEPLWVFGLIGLTALVWVASAGVAKARAAWGRALWLALGVAGPMAALVYVKYGAFLLKPLLGLMHVELAPVRMPLGVSFFTFQIVTYVVDVYRKPSLYQKNPLDLLLYVSCFPQLVAGPIVRYQDVAAEMNGRATSMEDFTCGMKRFACGLGKKVLLANICGKIVSDVLSNQALYGMSVAGGWYMAALYSLQIYFDFSGYSDMAIGMGRIFGFHYAENFNYPYMSRSVAEFWRRWHISLGTFFREYLYIPMGGNRCSKPRQLFNLLVVWGLTGLWHGASLNFVLWGAVLLCAAGVGAVCAQAHPAQAARVFERLGHVCAGAGRLGDLFLYRYGGDGRVPAISGGNWAKRRAAADYAGIMDCAQPIFLVSAACVCRRLSAGARHPHGCAAAA